MEYLKVKSKQLKKYGKIIDKTLYLKEGIYTMNSPNLVNNELIIKTTYSKKLDG